MLTCASCGAENPDGARFCMSCAAPLTIPLERREERKVVSVLFADLVGFTSRSEQLDVEEVRGTLEPYQARLRQILERFGGEVHRRRGDGGLRSTRGAGRRRRAGGTSRACDPRFDRRAGPGAR